MHAPTTGVVTRRFSPRRPPGWRRDKLSWTQTTAEIEVRVRLPRGTRAREVSVSVTPTRLSVSLGWHGRVVDGPLFRRCKASEAAWALEGADLTVVLPKDDPFFWKALFEGGEEKSHFEVLRELVAADEPAPCFGELDERGRNLVEDIREYQARGCGPCPRLLLRPGGCLLTRREKRAASGRPVAQLRVARRLLPPRRRW